jgi:hypothetical protein
MKINNLVQRQIEDILNEKWADDPLCMCKYAKWPCVNNHVCTDACSIYLAKRSGANGVVINIKVGERLPFNICPIDMDYCQRNFDCHSCSRGEA